MLQVAGTEALEKVLVPRGITLQPYFVGAAHEWRAAAKRSSPAQRTERTHAQDGLRLERLELEARTGDKRVMHGRPISL